MWKVLRQAARSSWFTPRQWRTEPICTVETDDHSSKTVSAHSDLFTRNINTNDVPKNSFDDHACSNKRKKSSYKDEYGSFRIHPSFFEAISWLGTSFVLAANLKLKLCHFHRNRCYQYDNQENYSNQCMRHGLFTSFANFWSFAFSMPNTRKAVLPDKSKNEILKPTKTTLNEEKSKKSEHPPYEKGYDQMKIASAKYIGHIENVIGLQLLSKDPAHAFRHFKAAGDLGCSKANFNLGLCYELGKGTKRDLAKAVHYYQLAASDGHGFAMYNLGIYYIDGLGGLEKDDVVGLQQIEKAAELGVPEAQNFLGIQCLDNEKWDEAFKYFEQSAQHNFSDSQYYLGLCYENGWGVNINYSKAAEYFSSAAANGHLEAKINLQNYPDRDNMKIPNISTDATHETLPNCFQETVHISEEAHTLQFKESDTRKNCIQNKGQHNSSASIHPSSSSPELSCMNSPTQQHPLTSHDISDYLKLNVDNIWQRVDHKRNYWFDSDTVSHLDDELPHWASTPSLLTVT